MDVTPPDPTNVPVAATSAVPSSADLPEFGEDQLAEQEAEGDWSGADIDEAYRRALEVMEQAWETVGQTPPPAELPLGDADSGEPAFPAIADQATAATLSSEHSVSDVTGSAADNERSPSAAQDSAGPVTGLRLAAGSVPLEWGPANAAITPQQVLEAALFVGGGPLTAKRLASVLRLNADSHEIERLVDELNQRYADEARPYEVRLGDGGYQLRLRDEYEKLRHKVYGLGPRDVKLSQEALEVLALVAYKEPITVAEVEACGKPGAGSVLRQLLRRELIALERSPQNPKQVTYRTTARFLSVFGLGSLEELPTPDDLTLK